MCVKLSQKIDLVVLGVVTGTGHCVVSLPISVASRWVRGFPTELMRRKQLLCGVVSHLGYI